MKKTVCVLANAVCPERAEGPGLYCPHWQTWTEDNLMTGESKTISDCQLRHQMRHLTMAIQAANRPAEQINRMQQGIQTAVVQLAKQAMQPPQRRLPDA